MRIAQGSPHHPRARFATLLACALLFLVPVASSPSVADDTRTTTLSFSGDRLSGVVLPIEPRKGNINFNALRARAWSVNDTKRLLLTGDVLIQIAGFTFEGEHAVAWVNRVPSKDGLINQVAIWLPEAYHRTSEAGSGPKGRNLLILGSARGEVNLNIAMLQKGAPSKSGMVRLAEQRLSAYLQNIQKGKPALNDRPQVLGIAEQPEFVPVPGGSIPGEHLPTGGIDRAPRPWLRSPGGVVSFSANTVKLDTGKDENTLVADGKVVLDYRPGGGNASGGNLRLTAERAVVFLEPGSVRDMASRRLSVDDVRGVYLEGAVHAESDKDDYVVRAPRMYYDFQSDRAIMLDAVLRTYDRKRALPVYARASEMRQVAETQWSAKHVTVSASSFATPTLAIGARSVVVDQVPGGLTETGQEEEGELLIDSQGNTLQAGGFPILWWPRYSGPIVNFPLRGVRGGWDEYEGAIAETTWDLYSLTGFERPEGWDMTIDIDGYTERGVGLGYDFEIETAGNSMALDLYGLKDSGTQRVDTGFSMDVPKDYRYAALWQQTIELSESWTFQGQLSYFSDATFVSAWREDDYRDRREYETSLYLKSESRNTAFSMLGKYTLNNFISNSWLIASQGYQVNKFPELTYRRIGDSLFGDWLTWSSEFNASRLQIVIPQGTPENSGLKASTFTNADGTPFGPNEPIEDAAQYAGLRQSWVNRLTTRQHLSMPMEWGAFNITPFAMVQAISYFEDDTDDPDNESRHQYYGSGGVRINTVLQRIYNDVHNDLLGLHRLRHLIEPYMMAWYGTSNYDADTSPLYEPLRDGINTGGVFRFGVTNTLQTQRGGPGRWYEVDWLTIDAAVVLSTDSATHRYPTPQFFDWEPGYSQLGNFVEGSYTWQFSDSLAFLGEGIWDLDTDKFARAASGFELNHSPRFSTFVQYRFVDVTDTKLLAFGGNYEVSDKYEIAVVPQWDFEREDFRSVRGNLTRSFPDFDFIMYVSYDQVRGETRVGAQLGQVNY